MVDTRDCGKEVAYRDKYTAISMEAWKCFYNSLFWIGVQKQAIVCEDINQYLEVCVASH